MNLQSVSALSLHSWVHSPTKEALRVRSLLIPLLKSKQVKFSRAWHQTHFSAPALFCGRGHSCTHQLQAYTLGNLCTTKPHC